MLLTIYRCFLDTNGNEIYGKKLKRTFEFHMTVYFDKDLCF